jgi:hypothetical protein
MEGIRSQPTTSSGQYGKLKHLRDFLLPDVPAFFRFQKRIYPSPTKNVFMVAFFYRFIVP